MAERSKQTRAQAEVAFRKAQKAERDKDKSSAMQEYESGIEATRKKTARLKELRLAKEAEDAKAAAKGAAKKKKPAPKG
ncbi:hypothetical protein [Microbaculum marinisediminis]|uniref:Uncharacterized protein n=1 Tax=Microbaculum marinisediminis TaxID=2931392 RepID=A0AAW5QU13_9HYPH|nr:hypothetical protein [Microbaculum sp. A6E488]MCT8970974.1 hypothetical protein [Microbaculum sp. A6E488]